MFDAAEDDESTQRQRSVISLPQPQQPANIAGQVMQPLASRNRDYQNRRIASLRRELQRMRTGVERVIAGLRELGDTVPDSLHASGRLAELDRSLDDILDNQPEDAIPTESIAHEPVMPVQAQRRGLESVQRRLDEAVRLQHEALSLRDRSRAHYNELDRHLERVRNEHAEAFANLDNAEDSVRIRRQEVERLQREKRTAENYMRVFGTREDFEREDYISPIGGMFNRAWERFRVAEDTRQEERTLRRVLDDEHQIEDARARRLAGEPDTDRDSPPPPADTEREDRLNEYYTMLRNQDWAQRHTADSDEANFPRSMLNAFHELNEEERQARVQYLASLDAQRAVAEAESISATNDRDVPQSNNILDQLLQTTPEPERSAIIARMTENGTAQALQETRLGGATPSNHLAMLRRLRETVPPIDSDSEDDEDQQGLDKEDGRPGPRAEEELSVRMDCKVCYTQVADTACLPCGHLVLCQWCSEQHSPVMEHDKTRPRRPANCPACRKRIKQKVRIYRA